MRPTHNSSAVCCATLLLILLAWNAEAQTITTIAGTELFGDGGPATSAQVAFPSGVAVDAGWNLFIADAGNQRIRKVAPARPLPGPGDRPLRHRQPVGIFSDAPTVMVQ